MKIEKYSPKWLLEKINASKTDAHKLMHIIEYRKELVESTEKQFAIHNVVGRSEQLLGFGRYLQKWSNTFLSEEHLKQEIENYLKDK